jgi:hypothetical protein
MIKKSIPDRRLFYNIYREAVVFPGEHVEQCGITVEETGKIRDIDGDKSVLEFSLDSLADCVVGLKECDPHRPLFEKTEEDFCSHSVVKCKHGSHAVAGGGETDVIYYRAGIDIDTPIQSRCF